MRRFIYLSAKYMKTADAIVFNEARRSSTREKRYNVVIIDISPLEGCCREVDNRRVRRRGGEVEELVSVDEEVSDVDIHAIRCCGSER